MTTILLIGVEPDLRARLHPRTNGADVSVQVASDPAQALTWIEQHHAEVPAVVLGAQLDEPVRLAQRIHRLDREISVLILSHPEHYSRVSRAIQFAPFLSPYVTTHLMTETAAIADTLQEAALHGRQGRRHQTTIAALNEQLVSAAVPRISTAHYLDRLLDYAPIGVMVLDARGGILSSNRRAEEIVARSERELLGVLLVDLFPAAERQRLVDIIARDGPADARPSREVVARPLSDGEARFVAISAEALPLEPAEGGALVILQDVTEQVVAEREREAALRLRDEFLAVAAHELKTPLTTIKGFSQLLRRLLRPAEWDRRRIIDLQERLRVQVERLELLVTDLLDVTRIQQGQLALRSEPVDLVDLVRRVLQRFTEDPPGMPRHALVLDAPVPVVGVWDPDRLDQVITNLVANAVKYSPDGSEVRVTVGRRGDQVELVVRDQGSGIAPELQPRLFEPFVRGETSGDVPGHGLGLYITAQIVQQHGGTIAVESVPAQGTTVIVRLPQTTAS